MRTVFIVSLSLLLGACSKDSPPPSPESRVAQVPAASVSPAVVPAGDATVGHRQANRVGCTGCHGKQGQGENELWDKPGKYIVRSANLTVKRALYDDAGLEQLLRHGKTHDGHANWHHQTCRAGFAYPADDDVQQTFDYDDEDQEQDKKDEDGSQPVQHLRSGQH